MSGTPPDYASGEETRSRAVLWSVGNPPESPSRQQAGKPRVFWNALLFGLTCVSTLAAGWVNALGFLYGDAVPGEGEATAFLLAALRDPAIWFHGALYSVSILFILGCHEMGHYLMCRRYGVDATLPYFIPFPSLAGTMGAFIRIRSPIPTKRVLFDIGIAGPFAGFAVAVPLAFIGLLMSQPAPETPSMMIFGEPLLMSWMGALVLPPAPDGMVLVLHPVGFAAWLGFLVTAFNLLPVGQLDGGHVLYAWIGDAARWVGWAAFGLALTLAYWWPGWLIWCVIFLVMGFRHPRVLHPAEPLDPMRVRLAWLGVAVLVVSFIPVPVRFL